MWVNVKIREKKKRKASFMEIVKTFQRKTTLHLLTLVQFLQREVQFSQQHLKNKYSSYTNV